MNRQKMEDACISKFGLHGGLLSVNDSRGRVYNGKVMDYNLKLRLRVQWNSAAVY